MNNVNNNPTNMNNYYFIVNKIIHIIHNCFKKNNSFQWKSKLTLAVASVSV